MWCGRRGEREINLTQPLQRYHDSLVGCYTVYDIHLLTARNVTAGAGLYDAEVSAKSLLPVIHPHSMSSYRQPTPGGEPGVILLASHPSFTYWTYCQWRSGSPNMSPLVNSS
jgi:hypothetical protein